MTPMAGDTLTEVTGKVHEKNVAPVKTHPRELRRRGLEGNRTRDCLSQQIPSLSSVPGPPLRTVPPFLSPDVGIKLMCSPSPINRRLARCLTNVTCPVTVPQRYSGPPGKQTDSKQGHTTPPGLRKGSVRLSAGQKASPHGLTASQDRLAFLLGVPWGWRGLGVHLAQLSELTAEQSEDQKGGCQAQVPGAWPHPRSAAAPSLLKRLSYPSAPSPDTGSGGPGEQTLPSGHFPRCRPKACSACPTHSPPARVPPQPPELGEASPRPAGSPLASTGI